MKIHDPTAGRGDSAYIVPESTIYRHQLNEAFILM